MQFLIKNWKVILVSVLLILLIVVIIIWQVVLTQPLRKAKKQVENYDQYVYVAREFEKIKKSDNDFIYYYGADNKRYVFPTIEIFNTWFRGVTIEDIAYQDLETMYQTALGGNVNFRPGTLMKSQTIPKVYIVINNGNIRPFADETMLDKVYGSNWQQRVYEIADYYFSQYKEGAPINSIADFPEIPGNITIDSDKNLK